MLEKILNQFRGNRIYPILAAAAVVVALVGGSVAVRLLSRSDTPQSLPTSSTSDDPTSRAGQPSTTVTPPFSASPTADPPTATATTTSGGSAPTTRPPTNGSTTPGTPGTPTTPTVPTTQTTTGTQTSTGTTPPATPDWVLLWSQEFSGSSVPAPFYADMCPPSYLSVSGGMLRLDVPPDAACYTYARHDGQFLNGMAVEVRARANTPPSGSLTAQILLLRPSGDVGVPLVGLTGSFRTYRAELADGGVTWYADGQLIQTGNAGSTLRIEARGSGNTELYTAIEVDYVRVYERSS